MCTTCFFFVDQATNLERESDKHPWHLRRFLGQGFPCRRGEASRRDPCADCFPPGLAVLLEENNNMREDESKSERIAVIV